MGVECPSDFGATFDGNYFDIQKALHHAGLFVVCRAVQFVKNLAVLFTFHRFYGIIQLIDKLEFD